MDTRDKDNGVDAKAKRQAAKCDRYPDGCPLSNDPGLLKSTGAERIWLDAEKIWGAVDDLEKQVEYLSEQLNSVASAATKSSGVRIIRTGPSKTQQAVAFAIAILVMVLGFILFVEIFGDLSISNNSRGEITGVPTKTTQEHPVIENSQKRELRQ